LFLVAAALLWQMPSQANAANNLTFDTASVMRQAKSAQSELSSSMRQPSMRSEWEKRRWWEEDCTYYSAERSGEITYKTNTLISQEYIERCHEEVEHRASSGRPGPGGPGGHPGGPGGHHGGPGGPGGPGGHPGGHPGGFPGGGPGGYHGGHDGPPQMETVCETYKGDSVTRYVQLHIEARDIFPWEKEKFSFCLKRDDLRFSINASAYTYERQASVLPGYPSVNYMSLSPQQKNAMSPDSEGITIAQAGAVEGVARVVLADKWWQEYKSWPNEKVSITVKLMKRGFLWISKPVLEETQEFAPAQNYTIDFNIANQQLKKGKYFFECSFTRVGAISKPTQVKIAKSAAFDIKP